MELSNYIAVLNIISLPTFANNKCITCLYDKYKSVIAFMPAGKTVWKPLDIELNLEQVWYLEVSNLYRKSNTIQFSSIACQFLIFIREKKNSEVHQTVENIDLKRT